MRAAVRQMGEDSVDGAYLQLDSVPPCDMLPRKGLSFRRCPGAGADGWRSAANCVNGLIKGGQDVRDLIGAVGWIEAS